MVIRGQKNTSIVFKQEHGSRFIVVNQFFVNKLFLCSSDAIIVSHVLSLGSKTLNPVILC